MTVVSFLSPEKLLLLKIQPLNSNTIVMYNLLCMFIIKTNCNIVLNKKGKMFPSKETLKKKK